MSVAAFCRTFTIGGYSAGMTRDILIEAIPLGAYLRVAAIDPATGTEAVVVGPLGARGELEALAMRKLAREVRPAHAASR